ncbi:cellulase family glycosylhydrolase [Scatolibacter rhodanostii]|uniref:cellulase family glycosylhydrolase n=1 Tax=Scatolibacter rhodanostii TaxID=2014781 RepID=UPI000C085F7B|nr:cellulase family glycosylhydrolase [Scatolibacter rhodanostii]
MKKLVTSKGNIFVDWLGRHTLLHGINMVCKEKDRNYIGDYHDKDFETLRNGGFNVIRLGIFWDAVEPEPGKYDEHYLSKIDELIAMAAAHDIHVFLDMHQDLFGSQFSDGAPDWATLTDGYEHVQTDLWSESYLLSRAVQTAFDNFWNNKPACDGVGIQDHYIHMWKHIALRYKDNITVIGYDVMNEPFMGSGASEVLQALLSGLAEAMPNNLALNPNDSLALWSDSSKKEELIGLLTDKTLYTNLIQGAQGSSQQFEKTSLRTFYNRIARTIREVDQETMIFLETNYFSNAGMTSAITAIVDKNGLQDPNQAYAPHGYDILVDTDLYEQSCNARVEVIFEAHKQVQNKLNLPLLVGEWGCYPNASEKQLEQAAHLVQIFEKDLASDTYYDFSHLYHNPISKVIVRPYPMKAAGRILEYSYTHQNNRFHCKIQEEKSSTDTVIFVPNLESIKDVTLVPYGQGYTLEQIDGSHSGYVFLPALGYPEIRQIDFSLIQ